MAGGRRWTSTLGTVRNPTKLKVKAKGAETTLTLFNDEE
jgi:hypothetical protein